LKPYFRENVDELDDAEVFKLFNAVRVWTAEQVQLDSVANTYVLHVPSTSEITREVDLCYSDQNAIFKVARGPAVIKHKMSYILPVYLGVLKAKPRAKMIVYVYHYESIDVVKAVITAVFPQKRLLVIDGRQDEPKERIRELLAGDWDVAILSMVMLYCGISITDPDLLVTGIVSTLFVSGVLKQVLARVTRGDYRGRPVLQLFPCLELDRRANELCSEKDQEIARMYKAPSDLRLTPEIGSPVDHPNYEFLWWLGFSTVDRPDVLLQATKPGMQLGAVFSPALSCRNQPARIKYFDAAPAEFDAGRVTEMLAAIAQAGSVEVAAEPAPAVAADPQPAPVAAGAVVDPQPAPAVAAVAVGPQPAPAVAVAALAGAPQSISVGQKSGPGGRQKQQASVKPKGRGRPPKAAGGVEKQAKKPRGDKVEFADAQLWYIIFHQFLNGEFMLQCVWDKIEFGWNTNLTNTFTNHDNAMKEFEAYVKRVSAEERSKIVAALTPKDRAVAESLGVLQLLLAAPGADALEKYASYNEKDWDDFDYVRDRARIEDKITFVTHNEAAEEVRERLRLEDEERSRRTTKRPNPFVGRGASQQKRKAS
jgi:hypothetical protein